MLHVKMIDTHLHLWNPKVLRYAWLDENPLLNKAYLMQDYLEATKGILIEKAVFVQSECDPKQSEEEVKWVTGIASAFPVIQGIVAWAPVEIGYAARENYERLLVNKLVKGVRQIIQFEKDIDFCLRPKFIEGVKALEEYDLHFELCISHVQLENTIELVKKCPNIRFVLDHIGKPDIKNGIDEPWKSQIKILSQMKNVSCKLSGLVNEAKHHEWTKEELHPYLQHTIDCFGVDRVMYGGDWPVILMASEYKDWCSAFNSFIQGYSENEIAKICYKNADLIYRLD